MIYVASPYSSPSPATREWRFQRVCDFITVLIAQGKVAFSPIAYCHPIAQRLGCPTDAAYWKAFNDDMMRAADEIYVLKLPGWELSIGVAAEVADAHELDLPIRFFNEDFTPCE